ncbi:MAG: branched-chain amino acid transporter permease [Frankiales bacterium]|jgi:branched-chain amino acid transport system permease protein|nr:branched-chain amino acid transporter permease [Frankiales bacterium]
MIHRIPTGNARAVVLVLLVVLAGGLVSGYERLATEMLVFALFAVSLNLLLGYTGLPSLGHGLYFGVGAYSTGILVQRYTENVLVALVTGLLVGALVAAVVGLFALRTAGAYFLMLTFAFGQLGLAFTVEFADLTGGADGLPGILRPQLPVASIQLYDPRQFYYFVAVIVLVALLAVVQLQRSPFGRTLVGIRENPERMAALGFNIWLHRYAAFVVSGAVAGLAGVLIAYLNGFVSPELIGLTTSAEVLLMVVLGGSGTVLGPLVGAVAILGLEEFTKGYGDRWRMLLGLMYVITVLLARRGLVHVVPDLLRRLDRKRRRGSGAPDADVPLALDRPTTTGGRV